MVQQVERLNVSETSLVFSTAPFDLIWIRNSGIAWLRSFQNYFKIKSQLKLIYASQEVLLMNCKNKPSNSIISLIHETHSALRGIYFLLWIIRFKPSTTNAFSLWDNAFSMYNLNSMIYQSNFLVFLAFFTVLRCYMHIFCVLNSRNRTPGLINSTKKYIF